MTHQGRNDHRSAIATGFIAGCSVTAVVAASTWSLWQWQRRKEQGRQDTSNADDGDGYSSLPSEIREEQLSRHTLYFGEAGMDKLRRARVCVVGVGGVGSHTAHMLARSGLGHLRLIDFDQVTVSSLNRHACAVLSDVGTPKVDCCARFLRRICPDPQYLRIETMAEMYTVESGERLLQLSSTSSSRRSNGNHLNGYHASPSKLETTETAPSDDGDWDMVIDCIDDVPTKAALLAHCLQRHIKVVSCMGAGGKADPTRLHISDLRSAAKDPLATKLRQTLKQHVKQQNSASSGNANGNGNSIDESYLDDMEQLTILYSSEKTVVKLADFTAEQKEAGVHKFGAVDGMRIRVIPVLGTMPAIMGQALASICLTSLAAASASSTDGFPPVMQPVTSERVGRNARNKLYQTLRSREQVLATRIQSEYATAIAAAATASSNKTDIDGALSVPTMQLTTSVHGDGELYAFPSPNGTTSSPSRVVWIGELQIDQNEDVEYLLEIWRNRCAVTGARLGTVLHLARWDVSRPSTCDNLVLVSANVLPHMEADKLQGYKSAMDARIKSTIEQRLASCRIDR